MLSAESEGVHSCTSTTLLQWLPRVTVATAVIVHTVVGVLLNPEVEW